MKRLLAFGTGCFAALWLGGSQVRADNLGVANDYNVFTLGNDLQYGTDAAGRLAVGGNANFTTTGSSYTVNSANLSGTGIVVGGALTNSGNTMDGNIYSNGAISLSSPTVNGNVYGNSGVAFTGGGTISGTVNLVTGQTYTHAQSYAPFTTPNYQSTAYLLPANSTATGDPGTATSISSYFSSASTYLTNHSTGWGALAANGTTTLSTNNITLTSGGTNALMADIFLISGTQLQNATSLTINATSGNSVLINVTGLANHTDLFPNIGITINGADSTKVVYNFFQATGGLTLNGVGVNGSILAPFSNVTFTGGDINGTLIANNLSGTGEAHSYPFSGNLPSVALAATPEPDAVVLFCAILISGSILLRRRRNSPSRPAP